MQAIRQFNLFDEVEKESRTIKEVAMEAGVSTATVRNWLKTGYLEPSVRGCVSVESLNRFQKEIAGKEKLNSRANKSLRDEHDHGYITEVIDMKLDEGSTDPASIGGLYEDFLSNSYRNREGIYYTPTEIVSDLLSYTDLDPGTATFCDPCCGGGNFISQALKLGFKPENVYGYDTDPVAVKVTKERIKREAGFVSENILEADFLNEVVSSKAGLFDCIYTNPPWGKKIEKKAKEAIGRQLKAGNALDTSSLFFFACIKSLEEKGELGLLLPEAFFNISNYEATRLRVLDFTISRMVDYGKPFKGLVTKAQAIVLQKSPNNAQRTITCSSKNEIYSRTSKSFSKNPKTIFNLYCSGEDTKVLSHLFSLPYITLKDRAKWALGIVTGNNKKFSKNTHEEGYIPVYKGSDILNPELKEPTTFIPSDLSLYQQVAPKELYEADEKLIYKFISSKLSFFYDTEQRFILNSANLLIPDIDFPVPAKTLTDLLNSSFMNWIFTKLFNTHKVLRGDIEYLPIHSQFLENQIFCEDQFFQKLGIEKQKDGSFRIKE